MSKNNKVSVAAANEAARKQKRNSVIITVCVIVAAVAILALAVYNYAGDAISGIILRNTTVAETEDFEVNGAMMSYMLSANVQSYSSYLSLLGVDSSVSLKEQLCPLMADADATWFDYFMETTKSQVAEILIFAQGAKDAGIELSAEEQAALDEAVVNIEAEAATYGYPDVKTYLYYMTGNAINVSDVRDCLELNTLASKYYTHVIDSVQPTDEEREAYYTENADSFNYIDVYKYDILSSDFEEYDEEGTIINNAAEQSELAKAYAQELAAIEGVDSFAEAIKAEIEKVNEQRESETKEQFIERKEELFKSAYGEYTAVSGLSEEIKEWVKTAEVGDTYVSGVEGATTYTVYMLVKTPYRDEQMSRDIRHILFSNEEYADSTEAQKILDEFVAAGATEEEFIRLAKEYSADTSAEDGGLIENVIEGEMVESFETWMFDEARQVGDYGMIESDYGWHLMFYPGEGEYTYWEVTANNAIAQKAADDFYTEKAAAIVFNEKGLNKIAA